MRRVLFDTSVALRLFDEDDPRYLTLVEIVNGLIDEGSFLLLAPQVLFEARVVLTRPKADNGQGHTATEFADLIERVKAVATLLPDPSDLVERWLDVCARHGIVGKRCHDARLVAWMEAYGVDAILTLNPRDFAAFSVTVLSPGG